MTVEAGQQLLHYRLIEKIGEGGMGVVWKALDTTLDRGVAIKMVSAAFGEPAVPTQGCRNSRVVVSKRPARRNVTGT